MGMGQFDAIRAPSPANCQSSPLVAITNNEFQRPDLADDLRALRACEGGHEGKQHLPHPLAERLQRRAEAVSVGE